MSARAARFTRRDLFKIAPLAAASVAGVGLPLLLGADDPPIEVRAGTCKLCLMHCGLRAHVRGGTLVKLEGDIASRRRGFICHNGLALREVVRAPTRVAHPLLREGGAGGALQRVSWERALSTVADRLLELRLRHGAECLHVHSGWPFGRHPLVGFLHRFARAFGSPNVSTVASLCEATLRMGQALVVGSKYAPDLAGARTLVLWGANPSVSAPAIAPHFSEARGGRLIVIDPIRTEVARTASEFLQIRPGTDGALALTLIHHLLANGLVDRRRLERDTVGLEALERTAAAYPLERGSSLTSLPAEQIARVARRLATEGPVSVWAGLGVEHHGAGVQTVRAISALEVLCGRFPNGAVGPTVLTPASDSAPGELLPALYRMRTPAPAPPEPKARPIGAERYPLFELYNREAQAEQLASAILEGDPYPVRALVLFGSNALVTSGATTRLKEAVRKLELLVVVDPFLTLTAKAAHVVLPATTFAESDPLPSEGDVRLLPPFGESRPDYDILAALAGALGMGSLFPWTTLAQAMRATMVPFMRDAALEPRLPREPGFRFGTPSGRAELESELLTARGYPGTPEWTPPSHAVSPEFPLWLVAGPRPRAYINSQLHGAASLATRLREPTLRMHSRSAAQAGLTPGARVAVVSPSGRATATLEVSDDVHPEVVVAPSGFESLEINTLSSPDGLDPISGFPAFRSGVCRVEPAPPSP